MTKNALTLQGFSENLYKLSVCLNSKNKRIKRKPKIRDPSDLSENSHEDFMKHCFRGYRYSCANGPLLPLEPGCAPRCSLPALWYQLFLQAVHWAAWTHHTSTKLMWTTKNSIIFFSNEETESVWSTRTSTKERVEQPGWQGWNIKWKEKEGGAMGEPFLTYSSC